MTARVQLDPGWNQLEPLWRRPTAWLSFPRHSLVSLLSPRGLGEDDQSDGCSEKDDREVQVPALWRESRLVVVERCKDIWQRDLFHVLGLIPCVLGDGAW